jgi:tape measure domain-containing protein
MATTSPGAIIQMRVEGADASQRQITAVSQSMNRLSDTVQSAQAKLAQMAATVGVGGGLTYIIAMSDQYTKFTAQLRLATQSQAEYGNALAEVKRISSTAQSSLGDTGTLYARIANGTRELGISQKEVANITETVSLALKVSGATASESASAMLQLSQSFASGTLRGEEFNAVNEAAPRLMKALADGMGVPVGALKEMASNGEITSKVMAETLPGALESLRGEATKIQTISGALQVLKDRAMEFTAVRAQENGMVAGLTSAIGLLADNLVLVTGALSTLTAVKLVTWLDGSITRTMASAAANRTLAATNLTTAESEVAAAATASLLATARVNELRAAVLAAEGNIQLQLTTNGLIPAQARQLAMTEALDAALLKLAVAQRAASTVASTTSSVIAALGGPLGAIVTVLGIAATAWMWYSSKSEEANRNASATTEASSQEIVESLEKQNVKLRERLVLQQRYDIGNAASSGGPEIERLASYAAELDRLTQKQREFAKAGAQLDVGDQLQMINVQGLYDNLKKVVDANKSLRAEVDKSGAASKDLAAVRSRLAGVNQQYLDDLTKLQTAYEKGAIGQAEYTKLVSQLATETWKASTAGKDAEKQSKESEKQARASESATKKQVDSYRTLIDSIKEKTAQNLLDLRSGENATESQKAQIKLDQELSSGKRKLASSVVAAMDAEARRAIAAQATSEQLLRSQAAEREVTKYIAAGTIAREESNAALRAEAAAYGKSADARDVLMVAVNAEAEMLREIQKLKDAHTPAEEAELKRLAEERDLRTQIAQANMGQSKAYAYATQLADENKKFAAESLLDEKDRAAALLAIDAKMWEERIQLAGAGTEAQKALQTQYDIWYSNQSLKPQIDEQKKVWTSIESTAHDTFVSIFDSGKSSFDRLRDTLKNGLLDLLYQMTVKKWIFNIGASVGLSGGSVGLPQVAGALNGNATTAGSNSLITAAQTASSMYKSITGGFEALSDTVAGYVQTGMNALGYTPTAASGLSTAGGQALTPLASGAGAAAGIAGGIAGGIYGGRLVSGGYGSNGAVNTGTAVGAVVGSIVPVIGTALGAVVGGLLGGAYNRLFGYKAAEVESQGIRGTYSGQAVDAESYENILRKGGLFRSNKRDVVETPFTSDLQKQFVEGFGTLKSVAAGFAGSLNVSAGALDNYSKAFDIKLSKDAAANEKAITDFFTGVGDEIALRLVPGLAQFNKSGETMSTTLQRLAGDFDVTNQVAVLLGKNGTSMFGSLGIESAAARERLIELTGGVSNLSTLATSFNQNYLTEAERLKPVAEAVASAMGSLGLASITTREQFKTTLLALDPLNAAQAQQIASMLALQESFAQVHPAIEATTAALRSEADILNEKSDLQKRLDAATMTTAQINAKARQAIAPANLALYDQVMAQEQLKSATEAATTSLKSTIDGLTSARTSTLAYRDSLMTGSLSTLTPMQKYLETQKQYALALAKAKASPEDSAANSAAQTAATAFLTASQTIYASSSAFVSDRSTVLRDMSSLADIADAQISEAQRQLDMSTQQVAGIATLNTTALGIQQAIIDLAANGTAVQAPALDLGRYSITSNESQAVLVAEIKRLNTRVDDLVKVTEGRRDDAKRQAADTQDAIDDIAPAVGEQVAELAKAGSWEQQNPSRRKVGG